MTPKERRRAIRKLKQQDTKRLESIEKEQLWVSLRAYHMRAVELHKALKDARDYIQGAAEDSYDEENKAVVADLDKILNPAPHTPTAEEKPLKDAIQKTVESLGVSEEVRVN